MHRTIIITDWKQGMLLSLILGIIFLSVGILTGNVLTGGTCDYLCVFGSCLVPPHECTAGDLLFWKYGLLTVASLCFLAAIIGYIKRKK